VRPLRRGFVAIVDNSVQFNRAGRLPAPVAPPPPRDERTEERGPYVGLEMPIVVERRESAIRTEQGALHQILGIVDIPGQQPGGTSELAAAFGDVQVEPRGGITQKGLIVAYGACNATQECRSLSA